MSMGPAAAAATTTGIGKRGGAGLGTGRVYETPNQPTPPQTLTRTLYLSSLSPATVAQRGGVMNAILEHRPFLYGYSLLLLGFAALALTYVIQGQPSARSPSSSSSMPFDERYLFFLAGSVLRPPQAASS